MLRNNKIVKKSSVNLLTKITDVSLFEKKLLAKELYSKFMVCNKINSSETYVLEDSFSTFNVSSQDCKKFIFTKHNAGNFSGHALLASSCTFTNRFYSFIRFEHFITKGSVYSSKGVLEPFFKMLSIFSLKSLNYFLFLNPIKGGFKCYSLGIKAFLPFRQFKVIFKKMFLKVKSISQISKLKSSFLPSLNLFTNKENIIKKHFLIRVPYFLGSLKIYPGFKKRNYSKSPTRKRRHFPASLNFVFVARKKKKKSHEKKV